MKKIVASILLLNIIHTSVALSIMDFPVLGIFLKKREYRNLLLERKKVELKIEENNKIMQDNLGNSNLIEHLPSTNISAEIIGLEMNLMFATTAQSAGSDKEKVMIGEKSWAQIERRIAYLKALQNILDLNNKIKSLNLQLQNVKSFFGKNELEQNKVADPIELEVNAPKTFWGRLRGWFSFVPFVRVPTVQVGVLSK